MDNVKKDTLSREYIAGFIDQDSLTVRFISE